MTRAVFGGAIADNRVKNIEYVEEKMEEIKLEVMIISNSNKVFSSKRKEKNRE